MSARCSDDPIYGVWILFSSSFSLTVWKSTLICFIQSYCTGLWVMLITDWLTQKILVGPSILILRFFRISLFHTISVSPCATALNSTSVLDLATTSCLLLIHVIRFQPKNVQYPVVDLRSTNEPASPDESRVILTWHLKCSPYLSCSVQVP